MKKPKKTQPVTDDLRMKAEDFDEIMRRALGVPPQSVPLVRVPRTHKKVKHAQKSDTK
jgi:hypothetical protein